MAATLKIIVWIFRFFVHILPSQIRQPSLYVSLGNYKEHTLVTPSPRNAFFVASFVEIPDSVYDLALIGVDHGN